MTAPSDRARVGERRLGDPARRPADRVVAALERRPAARGEVRHDDRDRDERDERPRRPRSRGPPAAGPGGARTRAPSPRRRARSAPSSGRRAPRPRRTRRADRSRGTRTPTGAAASRGRRGGSRRGRATASPGAGGTRARTRPPPSRSRRCLRAEEVHGDRAGRDGQRLARRGGATASGQTHQSGANADDDRVEVGAEPGDLPPVSPVTERTSPCAVDHTAWTRLPRSKRPVQKARCWSTASAPSPAANAAEPAADEPRGARHRRAAARSSSDRQRAPRTSSEARASYVSRPARAEPLAPARRRPRAAAPPRRAPAGRRRGRGARRRRR